LLLRLEHGLDISCLSMLNEEMINEIVPKVGDKAKLLTWEMAKSIRIS